MVGLFILLVFAHYLADYPLQGEFLAKAKNRFLPVDGAPWYQAMGAHAAIHGGMVYLITGVWWLFFAEFVAHFAIDHAKCAGRLSFDADQTAHVLCKVVWFLLLTLL